MNNHDDLKRLATAATQGKWVGDGDYHNEHGNLLYSYVAHERGGRVAKAIANCLVSDDGCRANAAYIAAANPTVVLGLIAAIEELSKRLEIDPRHSIDGIDARDATIKGLDGLADELRAVNSRLRADAELIGTNRAKIAGELSRLRAKHDDFSTGPDTEDAPYLFALANDRMGCTLDIDGQPYHYVEDSRVESLLLDAGRYRMARALACGYTSERGQTIVVELPRPDIIASAEGSDELLDAAIDAYIDDHPMEARHANEA
ncbi:hypothetical protein AB4P95_20265 [Pseudomonas sp. A1437]|uniref:hypothetical protein n=1 Tax=unclassified Pseudomonas TaxID=196821 RepID=UPI00378426CC